MSTGIKKIILVLLAIIFILLIYNFSSKDSNKSNSTSKELIYKTTIIYEKLTNKDIDNEKVVTKLNYPVRKLAHFTLYFLLGLFLYKFMLLTGINKKELVVIIICLLYAIMDEVHQMFVGGRTSQILDVFIDSLGFLTSIYLVRRLEKNKNCGTISTIKEGTNMEEIDLKELFEYFIKKIGYIILITAVVLLFGVLYSFFIKST